MIAWRDALVDVLEVALGPHHHLAAAGAVALAHAVDAVDDAGGGEVGRRHDLHQLVDRRLGHFSRCRQASTTSLRLCGGMLVAMPTAMPALPLTSRLGSGPAAPWALSRAVVVGREVDRLLVDVGQHLVGDLGQPDFGVAHGRGVVAVDAAEVALAVDQHVAQAEVLRHAHDGVVHRRVAVRVVLADHVADDARALLVGAVPVVVQLVHREQHAAVHRLEAVTRIGQCAPDDHAHRVIEVRPPHLLFEADGQGFLGEGVMQMRRGGAVGRRSAGADPSAWQPAILCGGQVSQPCNNSAPQRIWRLKIRTAEGPMAQ
jgi:hypothetical protein